MAPTNLWDRQVGLPYAHIANFNFYLVDDTDFGPKHTARAKLVARAAGVCSSPPLPSPTKSDDPGSDSNGKGP